MHADSVIPLAGLESQPFVGFHRVETLVLQLVGADLVREADAAPLFGDPGQRGVELGAAIALPRVKHIAAAAAVLAGVPGAPQAQQASDEARRLREAAVVFGEIMAAEDKAIPRALLGKAEGIAIFPGTVRAGFIVGGVRGRGVLSARTAGGWSAPAFLTLTGGSFGLQIGGQAADLILIINGRRGLENLVSNQFKLGADAAVAAGPVGRDAQAATDLQLWVA